MRLGHFKSVPDPFFARSRLAIVHFARFDTSPADAGHNIITVPMPYGSLVRKLGTVCLALAACVAPAAMQGVQINNQPTYPGVDQQSSTTQGGWEDQQHKQMMKMANTERQQEIRKDAEKLLELATELKHAVDKSNEHTLSLDVVKKAEQIEKLAKSVKEKMKGP